jgi:hypothetical protein
MYTGPLLAFIMQGIKMAPSSMKIASGLMACTKWGKDAEFLSAVIALKSALICAPF